MFNKSCQWLDSNPRCQLHHNHCPMGFGVLNVCFHAEARFHSSTSLSGQFYKASTIVNYDSRVVIYDRRGFIRLSTGNSAHWYITAEVTVEAVLTLVINCIFWLLVEFPSWKMKSCHCMQVEIMHAHLLYLGYQTLNRRYIIRYILTMY